MTKRSKFLLIFFFPFGTTDNYKLTSTLAFITSLAVLPPLVTFWEKLLHEKQQKMTSSGSGPPRKSKEAKGTKIRSTVFKNNKVILQNIRLDHYYYYGFQTVVI